MSEMPPNWEELAQQSIAANTTPVDIPAAVGGPPLLPYTPYRGWQPTADRHEGWIVYINPRTREVAFEVDGERLVELGPMPKEPSVGVITADRARQIAAECPLRWQDVRRILGEHSSMGYASWFDTGPADEVADFAWSCWLDTHTGEQD